MPANTPILTALAHDPIAALGSLPNPNPNPNPNLNLNLSNRSDVLGTLRHGLDLFPRARRLVIVTSAYDPQDALDAQVDLALTALGRGLEVENTEALSYEEMLHFVTALPPDTLVLMGSFSMNAMAAGEGVRSLSRTKPDCVCIHGSCSGRRVIRPARSSGSVWLGVARPRASLWITMFRNRRKVSTRMVVALGGPLGTPPFELARR